MKYTLLLFIFLAWSCTPLTQSSTYSASDGKTLRYQDWAYEPQIRTYSIHPAFEDPQATLLPGVTRLGDWNLVLEFDDLRAQRDTYYARIVHCNFDWTKSDLLDLDFMSSFNEFPINSFEFSVDTHIPYVHYQLPLPPVKLPGNYVVVVYRGSDKNDIVVSKRFMVYDTRITFENERNLIGAGSIAALNQQINFTVNYKHLDILNPLESVKTVIRQNQRWDNMAVDIRPSFVREIEKQLEYRFFDDSKMFKGGNEFRFFDLRSLNNPGRNVAYVNKTQKPFEVYLGKDKTRADEAYAQYLDLNGGYIIDNLDYRDNAFTNYTNVNFILSSGPIKGDVYVTGAFSNWNLDEENRMTYDSSRREYRGHMLLKQGWYDYQYLVQSPNLPPYHLEGSHFETENSYEILVYYRPFQPRADLLIG
ncbi:MAG: DUF5103 domain-containing protein, partial [Bacteroidota bacterium]